MGSIFREYDLDGFADGLIGRVAVESLGASVPTRDDTAEVGHNGVISGVHDHGKLLHKGVLTCSAHAAQKFEPQSGGP